MTDYTPRPGSKAETAIAALQRTPWMSATDLASELEIDDRNTVGGYLKAAITMGAIRRVARDGIAGFALGGSGTAVPEADEATAPGNTRRKPHEAPARIPRTDYIEYGHHVGICQDGRVIVIDGDGHVLELTAEAARRVAELVQRVGT